MSLKWTILVSGFSLILSGCEIENSFAPLDTSENRARPTMPSELMGEWYADSLELSWQDRSQSETYFEISWQTDTQGWSVPVFPVENSEHHSISEIPAGQQLTVRIRAGNSYGESAWLTWTSEIPGSSDGEADDDQTGAGDDIDVPAKPEFATVPGTPVYHPILREGRVGVQLYMGRDDGVGIDFVVVSEGYTEAQLGQFVQDAQQRVDEAFDFHPLRTHLPAWNIHFLSLASLESGADHAIEQGNLVDTRFGAHYWCGNTERLLCIDTNTVFRSVAEYVPQYDEILVLVNSSKYGGAGYSSGIATASLASAVVNLIRHEVAHSFAHLGDEYTYGRTSPPANEPSAMNLTLNSDPHTVKWTRWIDSPDSVVLDSGDGVGIFEGGAYVSSGVFRPMETSMMRQLGQPFGPVNSEAWAMAVYNGVEPVADFQPDTGDVTLPVGQAIWFALNPLYGAGSLNVQWQINNEDQPASEDSPFYFLLKGIEPGEFTVTATVTDSSGVVHQEMHTSARQVLNWQVTITED